MMKEQVCPHKFSRLIIFKNFKQKLNTTFTHNWKNHEIYARKFFDFNFIKDYQDFFIRYQFYICLCIPHIYSF